MIDGRATFFGLAAFVAIVMILTRNRLARVFAPDDYPGDWYGWTVNQTSHVAIGVLIVLVAALIGRALMGEYPLRVELFILALLYVLIFELVVQPWTGWDTVQDIAFMGVYGAGGSLWVFREVRPGQIEVSGDLWVAAVVVAVVLVHLAVGVALRVR